MTSGLLVGRLICSFATSRLIPQLVSPLNHALQCVPRTLQVPAVTALSKRNNSFINTTTCVCLKILSVSVSLKKNSDLLESTSIGGDVCFNLIQCRPNHLSSSTLNVALNIGPVTRRISSKGGYIQRIKRVARRVCCSRFRRNKYNRYWSKPGSVLCFWDYQWRTQKIFMGGGFIQWHMVVICL